jgi:hypothetical protein
MAEHLRESAFKWFSFTFTFLNRLGMLLGSVLKDAIQSKSFCHVPTREFAPIEIWAEL